MGPVNSTTQIELQALFDIIGTPHWADVEALQSPAWKKYLQRLPGKAPTLYRYACGCTVQLSQAAQRSAEQCMGLELIALYCTALHCTALHCTALHCTALHCTALHCTALHCTAAKQSDMHCASLHCFIKGHSTSVDSTSLHYAQTVCITPKSTTFAPAPSSAPYSKPV